VRRLLAALAPLLVAACAGAPAAGARSTDPWADAQPLGPLQVALLYHQLESTPAPPELALAWPELCRLHGDAQAAAAREAAPRLAAESARVERNRTWRVQVRQPLGPYDPAAGGYRTTLRDGAVIRFDPFNYCFKDLRYLLAFENGGAHALVRLDEEAARAMLRRDPSRTMTLDLLVEPEAARPVGDARALVVRIHRLRASDATGSVLFDGEGPDR
jgi:hypothetical protein